jgi:AAA domain
MSEWDEEPGLPDDRTNPWRDSLTDMEEIVRRPEQKPPLLEGLIYRGKFHAISGAPESGKTVLALHLAVMAMARGGPVVLIDHEAGAHQTGDILRSFGADPPTLAKLFHSFAFPDVSYRDHELADLHEYLDHVRPVLVIFDSLGEMLAANGADENRAPDVIRFANRVILPVMQADYQAAVIVTDHDSKDGGGTRYSRGSGGKLGKTDVTMKVAALSPFSHYQDGKLSLIVTKDRAGWLHRWWEIAVCHNPLGLTFTHSKPPSGGGSDLSPAEVKILAALTTEPQPTADVLDRLHDMQGHYLKRETMSRGLNRLVDLGLADRASEGREALWFLPDPLGAIRAPAVDEGPPS